MRGMQNMKNTREVSQPVWREVVGEGGCSGWALERLQGEGGRVERGGWFWGGLTDFFFFFLILSSQVNTQRKAIVQLILEKRELLVGQRVKRDGTGNRPRR